MAYNFPFVPEPIFSLATDIAEILIRGTKTAKRAIAVAALLALAGGGLFAYQRGVEWGQIFAVAAVVILFAALAYQQALKRTARAERIDEFEREAEAHPDKAKPAWDLASAKLEAYVARNLAQVTWIFGLVLIVMALGFAMIGWGLFRAFTQSDFNASLVATGSGILVQFIAATFLLIYKATMEQAKDYVAMLERINAVGMAAQLLEAIEDPDPKIKDGVRATLASSLLTMYQQSPVRIVAKAKTTKNAT